MDLDPWCVVGVKGEAIGLMAKRADWPFSFSTPPFLIRFTAEFQIPSFWKDLTFDRSSRDVWSPSTFWTRGKLRDERPEPPHFASHDSKILHFCIWEGIVPKSCVNASTPSPVVVGKAKESNQRTDRAKIRTCCFYTIPDPAYKYSAVQYSTCNVNVFLFAPLVHYYFSSTKKKKKTLRVWYSKLHIARPYDRNKESAFHFL